MICHQCGVWTEVLSTRQQQRGLVVKRERQCANGHRFSTLETHTKRPRRPEYYRRHTAGESINHIAHLRPRRRAPGHQSTESQDTIERIAAFGAPSPEEQARAELIKAKRALLVALTGRDYATAMVSYEQARIQRLSAYLNQPEVVELDAG